MIYLDNAATTFPKPHAVIREVTRCLEEYCGNPGRGAHPLAMASAERIYATREALSDFFGLGSPERIVFTENTTYALNLAIKGLFRGEEHVLISELEHNAVLRPLHAIGIEHGVTFDTFPVVGLDTNEILDGIRTRIRPDTAAVLCTHASNICSLSLPIREIGALCHAKGLLFLVDAAQSAGHLPIDMRAMHINALAAPGHKGLLGIQGAGILALSEDIQLPTLWEGGSGVDSLAREMPKEPPERYEAGTLPTPSIVSLLSGLAYVNARGLSDIAYREHALFDAARERLDTIPDVRIFLPQIKGSVLSFVKVGESAARTAEKLAQHGICVRAGLHCAPLAHRALGTPEGGSVRISFGPFNTVSDLDALWRALK